jgi:hypothetical protein
VQNGNNSRSSNNNHHLSSSSHLSSSNHHNSNISCLLSRPRPEQRDKGEDKVVAVTEEVEVVDDVVVVTEEAEAEAAEVVVMGPEAGARKTEWLTPCGESE